MTIRGMKMLVGVRGDGRDASHMQIHPALASSDRIQKLAKRQQLFTPDELLDLTVQIAGQTQLWRPLIRYTSESRWYEALVLSDALELWLIGWTPGQGTPIHDHGGAAGALTMATGRLVETVHADPSLTRPLRIIHAQGAGAGFAPHHIHGVANEGAVNAASVHAYSPAGLEMRVYDAAEQPRLVAAGSAADLGAVTVTGR
jgi:predicted metal-dependent enzyme (double-stranded beta helix superfamily)